MAIRNKPNAPQKLGECVLCGKDASHDEVVLLCEVHGQSYSSREQRLQLGHICALERIGATLEDVLELMRDGRAEASAALAPAGRGEARRQTVGDHGANNG